MPINPATHMAQSALLTFGCDVPNIYEQKEAHIYTPNHQVQPHGRVNSSVSCFPAKRSCFISYCRPDGIIYSYHTQLLVYHTPVTFPCTLLCFKSYCITSTARRSDDIKHCCVWHSVWSLCPPLLSCSWQAGTDDEPIPGRGTVEARQASRMSDKKSQTFPT